MRKSEVEYWDKQFGGDLVHENVQKRQAIIANILKYDLMGKSVCEIGAGTGITANAVMSSLCGQMKYCGTEMSKISSDRIKELFGLDVAHAEITNIPYPDEKFDYVWAFDVLEHVHPTDRLSGYNEISRILKPGGSVLLNQPTADTHHDLNFDHGFYLVDVVDLVGALNGELMAFINYPIVLKNYGEIRYIWIHIKKKA